MQVKIQQTKSGYEGLVSIQGFRQTKLSRADGTSTFPTSGSVKVAASKIAKHYGWTVSYVEPAKAAAKKKPGTSN